jgi:hypothetical protein
MNEYVSPSTVSWSVSVQTGYDSEPSEFEILTELGIDRYKPLQVLRFTERQLLLLFLMNDVSIKGFDINIKIGK